MQRTVGVVKWSLTLVMTACVAGQVHTAAIQDAAAGTVLVKTGSTEGLIVSAKIAAAWLGRADTYWTPSLDEVTRFERDLPAYLGRIRSDRYSACDQHRTILQLAPGYRRQYVGIVRGKARILEVQLSQAEPSPAWKHGRQHVSDGGLPVFSVSMNVETGRYFGFTPEGGGLRLRQPTLPSSTGAHPSPPTIAPLTNRVGRRLQPSPWAHPR